MVHKRLAAPDLVNAVLQGAGSLVTAAGGRMRGAGEIEFAKDSLAPAANERRTPFGAVIHGAELHAEPEVGSSVHVQLDPPNSREGLAHS